MSWRTPFHFPSLCTRRSAKQWLPEVLTVWQTAFSFFQLHSWNGCSCLEIALFFFSTEHGLLLILIQKSLSASFKVEDWALLLLTICLGHNFQIRRLRRSSPTYVLWIHLKGFKKQLPTSCRGLSDSRYHTCQGRHKPLIQGLQYQLRQSKLMISVGSAVGLAELAVKHLLEVTHDTKLAP